MALKFNLVDFLKMIPRIVDRVPDDLKAGLIGKLMKQEDLEAASEDAEKAEEAFKTLYGLLMEAVDLRSAHEAPPEDRLATKSDTTGLLDAVQKLADPADENSLGAAFVALTQSINEQKPVEVKTLDPKGLATSDEVKDLAEKAKPDLTSLEKEIIGPDNEPGVRGLIGKPARKGEDVMTLVRSLVAAQEKNAKQSWMSVAWKGASLTTRIIVLAVVIALLSSIYNAIRNVSVDLNIFGGGGSNSSSTPDGGSRIDVPRTRGIDSGESSSNPSGDGSRINVPRTNQGSFKFRRRYDNLVMAKYKQYQ